MATSPPSLLRFKPPALCHFNQVFFHSITTIFFSSIEVLGKQNIPEHGPLIFTGNHSNQFVDGVIMIITSPHKVGFLMAEKSFHKPVVGQLASAVGSIPVTRPQDHTKKGVGTWQLGALPLGCSSPSRLLRGKKGART